MKIMIFNVNLCESHTCPIKGVEMAVNKFNFVHKLLQGWNVIPSK